jgi:hypothetical protein
MDLPRRALAAFLSAALAAAAFGQDAPPAEGPSAAARSPQDVSKDKHDPLSTASSCPSRSRRGDCVPEWMVRAQVTLLYPE